MGLRGSWASAHFRYGSVNLSHALETLNPQPDRSTQKKPEPKLQAQKKSDTQTLNPKRPKP